MKIVLEGVDPTTFNFVASALADVANILLATVLGAFYVIRVTKWIKADNGANNTLPVDVLGQIPTDLTSALNVAMGSGWTYPGVLILILFLAEYTSSIAFIGLDFVVLDRPGKNSTILNLVARNNDAFPYQLVGDPVRSGTISKLDLLLDEADAAASNTDESTTDELIQLANEEAVVSSFLGAADVIAQGNSPFTNQSKTFEINPTLLRLGRFKNRTEDPSDFPKGTKLIYSHDSSPLVSIPLVIPLECEEEPQRIQEAWGQDGRLDLTTTSLVPNCDFRSRRASGIYGDDHLPYADITAYVAMDHNISLYLRGLEHHELREDFDFPIDGAQLARDRVDFRNGRPVDDIGGLKFGNYTLPFDSAFLASGGPYPADGSFAEKFYAVLGQVQENECPHDPSGSPESACIAIITLGCIEFSEDLGVNTYIQPIKRCSVQYAEIVWGTSFSIDERLLVATAGVFSRQMKSAETLRQKSILAIHALPTAMFALASLETVPCVESVKSATINGIFVVFLAYPFVVCLVVAVLVLYSDRSVFRTRLPLDGWELIKLGTTVHTLPKQVQEAFQLDSQCVRFGLDRQGDFTLLPTKRNKAGFTGDSNQVAVSDGDLSPSPSLSLRSDKEVSSNPKSSALVPPIQRPEQDQLFDEVLQDSDPDIEKSPEVVARCKSSRPILSRIRQDEGTDDSVDGEVQSAEDGEADTQSTRSQTNDRKQDPTSSLESAEGKEGEVHASETQAIVYAESQAVTGMPSKNQGAAGVPETQEMVNAEANSTAGMQGAADVSETPGVAHAETDGATGLSSSIVAFLVDFCSNEKALVLACLICSALVLSFGVTTVALGGTLNQDKSESRQSLEITPAMNAMNNDMTDAYFMSRRDLIRAKNMYFGSRRDRRKAINQWGNISEWRVDYIQDFSYLFKWGSEDNSDDGIPNTFNEDVSNWNVSNGVSFRGMFRSAGRFSSDLSQWDVSSGVYFGAMFSGALAFSSDLSMWNVSRGSDFSIMFRSASAFSSDLSMWDVSRGTDFSGMFNGATAFSSDLSMWNVSTCTDFSIMFRWASAFSSDLSMWDVSRGTDFSGMFLGATAFSSDLSMWNVSKGTDFSNMFYRASTFSSDLSMWDVSRGADFSGMFYGLYGASVFSSDLSMWDVSQGTDFAHMFNGAIAFSSDLSNWDVSQGTYFSNMFNGASSFNSSLSDWDVSKGTHFYNMFRQASSFNSPLSSWEFNNVITFQSMFSQASSFDQNLCSWADKIVQANDYRGMFRETSCPVEEATLEAICQFCVPTASPTSTPTSAPSLAPTSLLLSKSNLSLSDP